MYENKLFHNISKSKFLILPQHVSVVHSYLNDGLTSIKFPQGKTLKLYGRILLPPSK